MHTTYLDPPIQVPVQQMAETLAESLQWVEMKIWDLEQRTEGAKGKVQTHYQEIWKELCHTQEALEEELMGLRMEEIPRVPTPSILSL